MPIDNFDGYFELGDLSQIEILPIKTMALVPEGTSAEDGLIIAMLEAGSNWRLTPITLSDDAGGEETQGYSLELNIIFPFADYSEVEALIKYYQKNPNEINHIVLGLSQAGEQVRSFYLKGLDYKDPLNSTPIGNREILVYPPFSMVLDIEPVDMRNRTKIVIRKHFDYEDNYSQNL